METKSFICINCPLGCPLTVTVENGEVKSVTGNTCKRGELYAVKEVTAPARTVTSTVRVLNGERPVVAVRTKTDIPKNKIFDCMKAINAAEITAPVHIGDIVIENVCGTGVNVVASAEDELNFLQKVYRASGQSPEARSAEREILLLTPKSGLGETNASHCYKTIQ